MAFGYDIIIFISNQSNRFYDEVGIWENRSRIQMENDMKEFKEINIKDLY